VNPINITKEANQIRHINSFLAHLLPITIAPSDQGSSFLEGPALYLSAAVTVRSETRLEVVRLAERRAPGFIFLPIHIYLASRRACLKEG